MTFFKTSPIFILVTGLCVFVSIGCSPKNTDDAESKTENAGLPDQGQQSENGVPVTDFTTGNGSPMVQVGDFVIDGDTLIAYTGKATNVEIPDNLGIKRVSHDAFVHSEVVSIVIPEEIESIRGFPNCYYLQSITVDQNNKNYTSIDGALFNKNKTEMLWFPRAKTGSFTIPNGVTSINWDLFSGCDGLTSVTIPASVTSITGIEYRNYYSSRYGADWSGDGGGYGYYSFESYGYYGFFGQHILDRPSLSSITVDQNNKNYTSVDGVLFNKAMTEMLYFPKTKTGSYTIPGGITKIEDNFFSGCNGLASVTIPASVTSIGESAFSGCGSLASVTIAPGVTSIGGGAFSGCGLTSVIIPASVNSIGGGAFSGCNVLTSVTVDQNNRNYTSVNGALFNKAITELVYFPLGKTGAYTIPNGVTRIEDNLFSGCSGLTSVTISPGVAYIGKGAFSKCSSLTSVTIPDSVTIIGEAAFSGCTSLTSVTAGQNNRNYTSVDGVLFNKAVTELVYFPRGKTGSYTIPNSVTSIGDYAFSGCYGLSSVTIPNSVTSIGEGAFSGCRSLVSVTIPNSVTNMGTGAFWDCTRLSKADLPDHVFYGEDKGGTYFLGCTGLKEYIVSGNNKNYTTVEGVLFNKDMTKLISFPQGKSGSYSIPNTVTSIGYKAFYDCTGLTSVTLPKSLTSIGAYVFSGCTNLTSVALPEGVTSIGRYAFSGCKRLASVTVPGSVESIGDFAFYRCVGLRQFTVDQNNKSYVLVNGVLFTKDKREFVCNLNNGSGESSLVAVN